MTATDYTIFVVAKQNVASATHFSIFDYAGGGDEISVGFNDNKFYSYISDGSNEAFYNSEVSSSYGLVTTSFNGAGGRLTTSMNQGGSASSIVSGWDATTTFNASRFNIGLRGASTFAKSNVEEIIVYKRELTIKEQSDIKGYLNTKYKIY